MAQQTIKFKVAGSGVWQQMTAERPGNWPIMTIPERKKWATDIVKAKHRDAYDIRGSA